MPADRSNKTFGETNGSRSKRRREGDDGGTTGKRSGSQQGKELSNDRSRGKPQDESGPNPTPSVMHRCPGRKGRGCDALVSNELAGLHCRFCRNQIQKKRNLE